MAPSSEGFNQKMTFIYSCVCLLGYNHTEIGRVLYLHKWSQSRIKFPVVIACS